MSTDLPVLRLHITRNGRCGVFPSWSTGQNDPWLARIKTTGHRPCRREALDNSAALDQFLASVERRAYRMAIIATSNHEDALDIVQDSMLRLVKRYADRDAEQWGPLFHRIVQSVIRDWYRRAAVRNRFRFFLGQRNQRDQGSEIAAEEDPIESHFATADPEPGAQLQQQQAIRRLDAALHRLPLRQQQVFLLRQWEGLSVRDTAQAMGCGEGSVKTHFSRALKALREQLQDHWQENET
ncbi:MAG TPA: RNA polymerase sigma factor [Gammaproteobacteria bacterium]|nr:RNA polymerase sigma factor [Gammaproteobacteria bacterium]